MQQEQKLQSVKKQEQAWKRELELEQQRQRQSSSRSRHWARTMATLHLCPLGAPTVCAEIKAKLKPDSLNGKRGGERGVEKLPRVQAGRSTNKMHSLHAKRAGRAVCRESKLGVRKTLAFSLCRLTDCVCFTNWCTTWHLCTLRIIIPPPATPLQTVQSSKAEKSTRKLREVRPTCL